MFYEDTEYYIYIYVNTIYPFCCWSKTLLFDLSKYSNIMFAQNNLNPVEEESKFIIKLYIYKYDEHTSTLYSFLDIQGPIIE